MKKVYLPIPGAPIPALLSYLHSKIPLTEAFDPTIIDMLEEIRIKEKEYHCVKTDGVMSTAYWIHEGYGFATIMVPDANGVPIRKVVDVFGPGRIMLHSDGFFNNEKTICEFWIVQHSVVVPFTQLNFANLKLSAPEASELANCILSDNLTLGLIKSCMLKMHARDLLIELTRIFQKDIWQYFSKNLLSDYTAVNYSYLAKLKNKMG